MRITFIIVALGVLLCISGINCDAETEPTEKEDCKKEGEDCGCSGANREHVADDIGPTTVKPDFGDKAAETTQKKPKKVKIAASDAKSNYARTNQMVYIEGGSFQMGTNDPKIMADGEGPAREVTLDSFFLDVHEVSNAEFELFVNSTSFKTEVQSLKLFTK